MDPFLSGLAAGTTHPTSYLDDSGGYSSDFPLPASTSALPASLQQNALTSTEMLKLAPTFLYGKSRFFCY